MPAFRQLFSVTARLIPPAVAGGAFTRLITLNPGHQIDFIEGVAPATSQIGDYAIQVGDEQFLCRQADFLQLFRVSTQPELQALRDIGAILGRYGHAAYQDDEIDEEEAEQGVQAIQPEIDMDGSVRYTHIGRVLHLAPVHVRTEVKVGDDTIVLAPGQALVPGTSQVIDLSLGFWRCDGAGNGLCDATAHPTVVAEKIRERLERDGDVPDQVTLEHFVDLRASMEAYVAHVRSLPEGSGQRLAGEQEIYRLGILLADPKGLKDLLNEEQARQATLARTGTKVTIDPSKSFIPTVDNIEDAVAIMLGDKKAAVAKEPGQAVLVLDGPAAAQTGRSLMAPGRGHSWFGGAARDVENKSPVHLSKVATLPAYMDEKLRAVTRPFFRTMTNVPLEDISGLGEPITCKNGAVARLDAWLRLNARILHEQNDVAPFEQMPAYRASNITHFAAAGMEFVSIADGHARFVCAWPAAQALQAKLVEDLRPKTTYIIQDVTAENEIYEVGIRIGIALDAVVQHLQAADNGSKLVVAYTKDDAGEKIAPVGIFAVAPTAAGGWTVLLSQGPNATAVDAVVKAEVEKYLSAAPRALPAPDPGAAGLAA